MASRFDITEDSPVAVADQAGRFAITEDEPIVSPDRGRFDLPQTVIDGSQDITSTLPDEQAILADEIFALTTDPNGAKTDVINTSYWSEKLEMRFDDAFDLKESIGKKLFGVQDISRNQILQGIRKMEVERYRQPSFQAAEEPGFFSRVWQSMRDNIITPRDIEGQIARGPFMAILLGRDEFPDLEQLHRKTFKQAVKDAYRQSGTRAVKSLAGRAQLIGDIGDKLQVLLDSDTPEARQLKSDLTEWGEYMAMASDQWYADNPDQQLQVQPGTGFLGTTAQYILHPENILQGTLETVPMLLTAALGHITGTKVAEKVGFGAKFIPWAGRVAGIAEPEIGEEYTNARAQGLDVENALAQSYTKAYTRAVIEEWTLGEKVKIFKGQFGKAASAGFAKKTGDLILGGKRAYVRGAGEEGVQSISDRFWEMVWGNSEEWFEDGITGLISRLTEGASEAAAVGGLLEMGLSGTFAVSGQVIDQAGRVNVREQVKRINNIRKDIKRNNTLDEQSKQEIDSVLDERVAQVEAEDAAAQPVAEVGAEGVAVAPESAQDVTEALEVGAENEFVRFEGVQEGVPEADIPDVRLFTLKKDTAGLTAGSTFAEQTLIDAGIELPTAEVIEGLQNVPENIQPLVDKFEGVTTGAEAAERINEADEQLIQTFLDSDFAEQRYGKDAKLSDLVKDIIAVSLQAETPARPKLTPREGETKDDFRARVRDAVEEFNQRVSEGRFRERAKPGPSQEATVKAELRKDAVVIKEARGVDQAVEKLKNEIKEIKKLRAENNKLKNTTQFDTALEEFSKKQIKEKTAELESKAEAINKKLRDRIQELADIKGLTGKTLSDLIKKSTGFTKLRGKVIEKKTSPGQLISLLEAVEKARPRRIGARVVLTKKVEDQIAAFKESLIKANRLTESEFKRILELAQSKGFGQTGLGKPKPARFISAESFITQEQARDLLDRMHDAAQVFSVTEPLNVAVENDPEIKAEMEKVKKQPSSLGDPSSKTISSRIVNAVNGTDFFDRLYSMRFYAQRLGDRASAPIYKLYNSLRRTGQGLARERQKVFKFLGTLPDFDKIAADNEALQRVSDAIASKSKLENRPEFPPDITKSELKLVKEIEKIFKVYEFHAKVGKFFQHKDDLSKMPQYLNFKDSIDKALVIYDTKGVDALFDYIKTQNWGVVAAGYEPMRSVIRKISTHQMPDVAVGKGHIKVRGIEYAKQDRNILQRLESYMRQMDMLAFMQPKIKAWVRLIDESIETFEDQENIRQVISTYLNNLKKTNLEDGLVEQVMMRIYSQAITVRVLADPIKPARNLLQNVAFSEDRGDLVNVNNERLTDEDLEYLETFVQQDRVMMSDWAFAGLDPLNLPLIGKHRLGIDKVTAWTQRHTLYPGSDRLNRHWSFWAKINRVRNAFAKDQSLADKMLEARFSDMQRSEQILALELLAFEGVDSMARFIAQVHTDNTHFLYAREDRSPAEQTRIGKLVLNLALFKRAATEKAVLQTQKATQQGSLQSRLRAAKVLVTLFAMSAVVNWVWKELTGKKFGAYDFINFLEVNSGGLELASVQKIEDVYNLMIRAAAKGDTKALAALPSAITSSADYFIPYYDLGARAIEATLDEKNLDIQVLQSIREMIDKEYRARRRPVVDRSLLEKFQFTFGGPGVDRKEPR